MPRRPGLPKMVASDLDGTLIRSDETVSGYTRQVLARVRAAGIPVVGATGRGPRLADLSLAAVGTVDFLVMAGGGRVLDLTGPDGPRTLRDARLAGVVLLELLDQLEELVGRLSVLVEVLDTPDAPLWGERHPSWRYPDRVEEMTRREALSGQVIKAFARPLGPWHPPAGWASIAAGATSRRPDRLDARDDYDVDAFLAVARSVMPADRVEITQSGLGYLELSPPEVDKGTGLSVVAATLGVDPSEVLVFGDMPNDLPMFAWAGFSRVAVANAHPRLLDLADEVTGSNDEDGVAAYLDRLLDGR